MIVRELFAKLGLDVNAQSFMKGQLAVDAIRLGLAKLVGFAHTAWHAIPHMIENLLDKAHELEVASQQTGISTDDLQRFGNAARMVELPFEALVHSMGLFNRQTVGALKGSGEAAATFRRLGVPLKDAAGQLRPTSALMSDLADAFAAMPDGAQKSAAAMTLFGRGGLEMIPFLNMGREEIAKLGAEGTILGKDTLEAAGVAEDSLKRVKFSVGSLKTAVAAELMPVVAGLLQKLAAWVMANKAVIKSAIKGTIAALLPVFRAFVAVVKDIAAVLGAAVKAIRWWWKAVTDTTQPVNMLIGALTAATIAYTVLGAASVKAGLMTMWAWIKATAPILAMFLIIDDIIAALQGRDSMIGRALKGLAKMSEGWLEDKGEPWFIRALKDLVWFIGHAKQAWDEFVRDFEAAPGKLMEWLGGPRAMTGERAAAIAAPFAAQLGMQRGGEGWRTAAEIASTRAQAAVWVNQERLAPTPGTRVVNAPPVSLQVTVNSPTGTAGEVAGKVRDVVTDVLNTSWRAAQAALGGE